MSILFFWTTMFVMLLCVGGLTAAIVLNSLIKLIFWMREFLTILTGAVLLMLVQLSVYQPYSFPAMTVENSFYTLVQISGILMAWGYLPLIGIWKDSPSPIQKYVPASIWSTFILASIILKWKGYYFPVFAYMPASSVLIPSIIFIIKIKELRRKEFGSFLVLFAAMSIAGYAFEFIEYFIRMSSHPVISSLPSGFFSFSGFSLVLALTSLFFCVRIIKAVKGQLSGNAPTENQIRSFCATNELTKRESQIVRKLLLRYTHKEIAEQLEISPRTVERHVYNIYQKTGLSSRFELYDLIRVEVGED
ncbi:MAG: helix-turn-helix transcriptional regulator [Spirochaetales bacterium]|nr:helix-turn-helix transcriptional regulator [Spirochaetales bacterium]